MEQSYLIKMIHKIKEHVRKPHVIFMLSAAAAIPVLVSTSDFSYFKNPNIRNYLYKKYISVTGHPTTTQPTQPPVNPPVYSSSTVTLSLENSSSLVFNQNNVADQISFDSEITMNNFKGVAVNLINRSDVTYLNGKSQISNPINSDTLTVSSVRASINTPFAKTQLYTKDANGNFKPFTINSYLDKNDSYLDKNDVSKSLSLFEDNIDVQFYSKNGSSYVPYNNKLREIFESDKDQLSARNFSNELKNKNISYMQIMFQNPYEFVTSCKSGAPLDECSIFNSEKAYESGLYKAANLVFQTRYGIAPEYVEIFNEPEGAWSVRVDSVNFQNVAISFNENLKKLIDYRLTKTKDLNEIASLNKLRNIKAVGPGIGSLYKFSYGEEGSYFDSKKEMDDFVAFVNGNNILLSSHAYDGKHGKDTTKEFNDLQSLLNNKDNIKISEIASSIELSKELQDYVTMCNSTGQVADIACLPAKEDDVKFTKYSYPNCISSEIYTNPNYIAAKNLCYLQNISLIQKLVNLTKNNASESYIWSIKATSDNSRNGLVIEKGKYPNKTSSRNLTFYSTNMISQSINNAAAIYKTSKDTETNPVILTKDASGMYSLILTNTTYANSSYNLNLSNYLNIKNIQVDSIYYSPSKDGSMTPNYNQSVANQTFNTNLNVTLTPKSVLILKFKAI